jgi:hypothetical protein
MMQVEDIEHIHQRWGPLYDNCDIWLQKVKRMLDPKNVCDWTAYIRRSMPTREIKKRNNCLHDTPEFSREILEVRGVSLPES